jgi:hypothetical protein
MAKQGQYRTTELSAALKRQWLVWGLLPVSVAGAVAVALSIVQGSPLLHGNRPQEVQLQAAMALVAAAFLGGFWVEGFRTATDRIVIRLAQALNKSLGDLAPADFRESAGTVEAIVAEAHWSALLLGWAGAVVPLVAAIAKMPANNVAVVALMSELYILYVLSRHHHALEVVDAAEHGELAAEAEALAQFRAFQPTMLQRIGLLLGWRPTFQPLPPKKEKKKTKRQ